ncbi:MAG: translation initiation factor IF-2 [Bdellovibrionales bacterium]|nr:translation initiation factor IF-2 [Bdellovibrionales bacterium]
MKVYDLAKKLELTSVQLIKKVKKELKLSIKSHMATLSPEDVQKIENLFSKEETKKTKKKTTQKKASVKTQKARKTSSIKKKIKVVKKESLEKDQASVKKPEIKPAKRQVILRRKDEAVKLDSPQKTKEKVIKKTGEEKLISPSMMSSKNMRLDLVSVKTTDPLEEWSPEEDKETPILDKKNPKKPIAEKEVISKFNATDFRKREVIFQPRKKRLAQVGEFKSTQITTPKSHKRILKVHGEMELEKLCKKIGIKKQILIKKLKSEGFNTAKLKVLDYETISLIISDFGWRVKNTKQTEKEILDQMAIQANKKDKKLVTKAPVVTIMGHVDHGKTTLLDTIRKTKVAQFEAGGITQQIGAYTVFLDEKPITFIDTPGHSAFTQMRSRGARVTDIVIILVAADDGVQPQTIEALNHVKSAKTPFIIAVSKIDVPGANIDKVREQMSKYDVLCEEWGGDVSFVPISGLKGEGIKELLEQIQLLAEMQELKYDPEDSATGVVLESRKEKGLGCIVSLLVQNGSLKIGSTLVVGEHVGRVRQMKNDQAQFIKSALAGFSVEMIGLNDLPQAGDSFCVVKNERSARDLINLRRSKKQLDTNFQEELNQEAILEKLENSSSKNKKSIFHIILKSDTGGSLEALKKSLEEIKSDEVELKIIHSGQGAITESDVLLASTVSGSVFGFNVRPDGKASQMAKRKLVPIYSYSVIYNLLDEVKKLLLGLLKSDFIEEDQGRAEVRDIFHISKIGTIAGCYVTKGKILRSSFIRLVREGRMVFNGPVSSVRRHKDDVKQVGEGFECGISLENFNDIKPKDILECYVKKEQVRTEL